ncbi:MAG: hypothetical protein OXF72_05500 [Gammaproteobacteria bacterium]|nr:hypothetical protein [Gammaproteobacteria bacterium]MCY4276659.1 hypothetical protein [Gammaproteobacteria bacterium]
MLSLSNAFAVDVYGYAVMSSHYHIALKVEPKRVAEYSDDEVARRWLIAYPPKAESQRDSKIAAILEDEERIKVLRERLGDLSWYMKCLNNYIARKANIEDDCTGKFWEARFHSSRPMKSLDDLYACMSYIDLNPLSAGATDAPAEPNDHTSLCHRMSEAQQYPEKMTSGLSPIGICPGTGRIHSDIKNALPLTLKNYLAHIEWLAECKRLGGKQIPAYTTISLPLITDPRSYMRSYLKFFKRWGRKEGRGDIPLRSLSMPTIE